MKPALNYSEQLETLRKRGLIINNDAQAINILRFTNYYRLSAYSLGLRKDDVFFPGSTIEQIYDIYCFDEKLRHLFFEVIEPIEIRLRAEISYHLSTNYGNIAHLNPELVTDKKKHLAFLSLYYSGLNASSATPCVKHNIEKYGELPIWAAVETLTFGALSKFYGNLKTGIQKPIARTFNSDVRRFPGWLESLCELRNRCAHSNRLYNISLTKNVKLYPNVFLIDDKEHIQNRIFPRLVVIKRIYNGTGKWSYFFNELKKLINENAESINLHHLGMPEDWLDLIDNA